MELASSLAKPKPNRIINISTQPRQFHSQQSRAKKAGFPLHPHPLHSLVASSSASASASSTSSEASLARDDLLLLIADEQRGLVTQKNPKKRADIIRTIDALTALGANMTTTTHQSLSATWRMLWTTEKEQLFIIEKAHLFGTQAGDILQVIDVEGKKLNNVITFPPDGAFLVDSAIEVVSSQRVNFRFTAASLRGSGWSVPVPPFGQGWFDSVYVDEKIRVAKDIRGDYLVVDKAPYTWKG